MGGIGDLIRSLLGIDEAIGEKVREEIDDLISPVTMDARRALALADQLYQDVVARPFFTGSAEAPSVRLKDFDVSGQCSKLEAYVRHGILHGWFSAPNLFGNAGRVYFVPKGISSLIRFGGVGSKICGVCRFENGDGSDKLAAGLADWERLPDGVLAVRFEFERKLEDESTPRRAYMSSGAAGQQDWPFQFGYGVAVEFSLAIP